MNQKYFDPSSGSDYSFWTVHPAVPDGPNRLQIIIDYMTIIILTYIMKCIDIYTRSLSK